MDLTKEDNRSIQDIEALYAKPMKAKGRKNKSETPSTTSEQSENFYDKLDHQRQPINQTSQRGLAQNETVNEDAVSMVSVSRSIVSQSGQSGMSVEGSDNVELYPMETIDTKDTNDVVRELRNLGLVNEAERLVSVLRGRFDLEAQLIAVCAEEGVTIVEGDEDDDGNGEEHKSIGGLRVKGMTPNYVNYDEYDPDIIKKYGHFQCGFDREEMANDAATLRRRAANMLWNVENMERMIDPNSRVKYVRQDEMPF
eukprot:gene6776-7539_t